MYKFKGFTLIELMIALVIVGILVGIAYPGYKAYILKSRRADALASLTQDQTILERCYAQNFSYSASCAGLPTFPHNSAQSYYSINLSNVSTSTFTLTATPIGNQVADTTCASMSVDQANQKTATNSVCWTM